MGQKSVAVVTNVPNPYRIPLFNVLDEELKKLGYDFLVVFGGAGYSRRKSAPDLASSRFRHVVLRSRMLSLGNAERTMFAYSGLFRLLRRSKPDIVIVIGYSLATIKIRLLSRFQPLKYVIWSGSVERRGRNDSTARRRLRRWLVKGASGYVAYGSLAKEYLAGLGAPAEKIHIGINTADTEYFAGETRRIREGRLPDDGIRHVLSVGYLTPRKNAGRIIEAVSVLAARRTDFVLDIVGDGEERARLEADVRRRGLEGRITFHGFKQKTDLPGFFAKSDCFVFQTDFDIWGLVLNEAMAAGLPCIASPNAGASRELIRDGVTGFVQDFSDAEAAAVRIAWVLDHPAEAREVGKRAALSVRKEASLRESALGFIRAVQEAEA